MNHIKLIAIGILFFISCAAKAQVSVNVNIGSPPQWGPIGYAEARYYYLPDVEAYYDVQTSMFIYYGGGTWIHRTYLPTIYANYDLYDGYKVVMNDYHGNEPYYNFKEYKVKYKKGYKGASQKTIGMKPGKGNSNKNKSPQNNSNSKQKQQNSGSQKSEQKDSKNNTNKGSKQQKGKK